MWHQNEEETQWINDLRSQNPGKLLKTLEEIYDDTVKRKEHNYTDALWEALLNVIENQGLSKVSLQIACKAFFQVLILSHDGGQDFSLDRLDFQHSRSGIYLVNGLLCSGYRKTVATEKLAKIVLDVAEICSQEHSNHILCALKNLISFCELHKSFKHDFEAILRIVWMNLTSCVAGVREQFMWLMGFVTKNCPERSKSIFLEILNRWSWMNPCKYYLLGVILANLSFEDFFDVDLFMEGLSSSLKHRNLHSPGQFLFRSLVKHKQVDITGIVRDILFTRSYQEANNFINQWLGSKDTDNLLEEIEIEEEEMDLPRYILVRRTFLSRNLPLQKVDLEALEPILRQHFYEILIHRITKGIEVGANLQFLEAFIRFHVSDSNTGLRNYIFKRLPGILLQLARKEHRESKETLEFFIFLKREIDSGLESDPEEYQRIIFALKMMDIVMRFLSCEYFLTKNKNTEGNKRIRKLLGTENVFKMVCMEDFRRILPLLRSNFDDIQKQAYDIIMMFYLNESEFCEEVRDIFQESLSSANSIESASSCHFYCKILTGFNEDLLDSILESLKASFNTFQDDPFASVQSGQHIFHKITCLTGILSISTRHDEQIPRLVDICSDITDKVLNLLNHTGEFEEAPSFELMEESLQVLINRSHVTASQPHPDSRKLLLLSLWMTLKACGDFSAVATQRLKDSHTFNREFRACLRINTSILQRCRHKGAIEAAGLSLGEIVRTIPNPEDPLLISPLDSLFVGKKKLSTTRRGAGYSIMLLNIVKNEASKDKKLLHRSMKILLAELRRENSSTEDNCDNLEAVMLHYLCVLVKDSSLAEEMLPFTADILAIAFEKIDSDEWTVRNGALQLCGALIPKIVGQKIHFQEDEEWQPVKVSVDDLRIRLSYVNSSLLATLTSSSQHSTTKIITILELLSRIEFWWTEIHSQENIKTFRSALWSLLSHPCNKIRLLAARCFSAFHEFHEIPDILFRIVEMLPKIADLNTFHGFILVSDFLTRKYRFENYAMPQHNIQDFLFNLQNAIQLNWSDLPKKRLCSFIKTYLTKFLSSIDSELVNKM